MKEILQQYPKALVKNAAKVKAIFFDVDGVLTDGTIIYDDGGKETKKFDVKDGLIVGHLRKANILVGAISGRESAAVSRRASELKFDFCHQGIVDKLSVFMKLIEHYKLKRKEVAYMGDDLNDLAILTEAGLSACPADSPVYLKKRVHLITASKGGHGAFRELADLVLASRGYFTKMLKDI